MSGFIGKLWSNMELRYTLLCLSFLLVGFSLEFLAKIAQIYLLPLYLLSYFFGSYFTLIEAWKTLHKERKLDIDFLMLFAALGAAILGEWAEGALLLFLFSLGHSMEHYALSKAKKSIEALADLTDKTAKVWRNNQWYIVEVDWLIPGDKVMVQPGQKIPADGILTEGIGAVNEAPITGESLPVDKSPVSESSLTKPFEHFDRSNQLFAGSICLDQVLYMHVFKAGADTSLGRLIEHVRNAQELKSQTQRFTDKLLSIYVPIVLIAVAGLNFVFLFKDESFFQSFYRAMAVLVAASPCALAISTPSAMLSGIARAARSGVLLKGGKPLENLRQCDILAFDKTGTITEGKPGIHEIVIASDDKKRLLISLIYAIEQYSAHPIALSMLEDIKSNYSEDLMELNVTDIQMIQGKGLIATWEEKQIYIGNLSLIEDDKSINYPKEIKEKYENIKLKGQSFFFVKIDNDVIGGIAIADKIRNGVPNVMVQLRSLGFNHLAILSGDIPEVVNEIARQSGINEAIGALLPEGKVKMIKKWQSQGKKVAMIGDGVNDAPAMIESHVGIAMGAIGAHLAMETADVVLMSDKIERLPFVMGLSKFTHRIVMQNIGISLGMVAILVPLTLFDIASMGPAVLMHEGSTVLVVLNALRLLAYTK
jgi:Cd2+/Zn2+-exporting ATPase